MKNVILPETVSATIGNTVGRVISNLWEKNDMIRLYVEVRFDKGASCKCGFIDLITGEVKFTTRGVDGKWADKVKSEMVIKY